YIGVDGQARLVNIALAKGQLEQRGEPEQVRAFGAMVAPLAGDAESERDTGILNRLVAYMESGTVTGGGGIAWSDLSRDARAAAMELEKGHVREMPGLERRARRENFRRKLIRLSLLVGGAMMVGLVFRGVLALVLLAGRPEVREFNEMIRVPAGSFVFQDETRELDAFWIDEYEVTVAQYAEFLEALGEPPLKDFDHPDQPPEKSAHVPPGWAESYRAASRGKFFHGHRIDLNSPVSLVDWWDAFAYAKWKGRRLPTEEEWEKAARGRVGNIYPWGDEFVPTHLNSSEDYAEDPMEDSAGTSDGYAFWSPVDAHPLDISEYSVLGLAGNVSEWTASWSSHPEYPDRQVPVKRGGSFATRSGYELALRRPANSPEEKAMTLGFRTASSTRPED
ncbi:MAG: formylglycine-generating enzyme family protein, partial [Verrucomicrobiales bacterium]